SGGNLPCGWMSGGWPLNGIIFTVSVCKSPAEYGLPSGSGGSRTLSRQHAELVHFQVMLRPQVNYTAGRSRTLMRLVRSQVPILSATAAQSKWEVSNLRPHRPERCALPTELHLDSLNGPI